MRGMTRKLYDVYGDTKIVGAEVGVFEGRHALEMLQTLNVERLYLIDAYHEYSQYYSDICFQEILDYARNAALGRLRQQPVLWLYHLSHKATRLIPELLDFVYIDANHVYDFALNDMKSYWNVIKINGYIGGHDYFDRREIGTEIIEVKSAVDDFAKKRELKVQIGSDTDWWILKQA